jgi:hypothetical protein
MTLPAFAAFSLGILVEIVMLWEQSRRQRNLTPRQWEILGLTLSTEQLVLVTAFAAVGAFIASVKLVGLASYTKA